MSPWTKPRRTTQPVPGQMTSWKEMVFHPSNSCSHTPCAFEFPSNSETKKQIWLIVLSLGGVLDARKTHTVAGRSNIMVAGSCWLGIDGKWWDWGSRWWLGKEGICWSEVWECVVEGTGNVGVLCFLWQWWVCCGSSFCWQVLGAFCLNQCGSS